MTLFEIVHINGTDQDINQGFHDAYSYQNFLSALTAQVRKLHEKGITLLYRPNLHIETDQTPIRILEPQINDSRIHTLTKRLPFLQGLAHIPLIILADSPLECTGTFKQAHDHTIAPHDRIVFGGKYISGCVLELTNQHQQRFPSKEVTYDTTLSFKGNW